MTEHGEAAAYAPFVALHEARLVHSLVSESGLSPAAAASVAADVLPVAYERSFASDGAAYGWLRVAARHFLAGTAAWADAADAALSSADLAAGALACLPAQDRELLRLRYVEGVLPADLAARLGVSEADVLARLDSARDATAGSEPAVADVSLPRAAAALACAAAAAFLFVGAGLPGLGSPAGAVPGRPVALDPPRLGTSVAEPVPAVDRGDLPVRTPAVPAVVAQRRAVRDPAAPRTPDRDAGCPTCGSKKLPDELRVRIPAEVAEALGVPDSEVSVTFEAAPDDVAVCDTVPAIPVGVASCVPGEH
jgi:DNA-directed RNA polymerase specialized sigma24 family protein